MLLVCCDTCFYVALLSSPHIYFGYFMLLDFHGSSLLQLVSHLLPKHFVLKMYAYTAIVLSLYISIQNWKRQLNSANCDRLELTQMMGSLILLMLIWWFSLVILIIAFLGYLTMKQEILSRKELSIGYVKKINWGQKWKVVKCFKECEKPSSDFLQPTNLKEENLV